MRQKIFSAIFFSCASLLVVVNIALLIVLESSLQTQAFDMLRQEATSLKPHLDSLITYESVPSSYRITLIAPSGEVLYDTHSDVSRSENHSQRVEIEGALQSGQAQSVRYSDTLKHDMLYFATMASLGDDEVVLRLALEKSTIEDLFVQFLPYFGLEFLGCLLLSFVIARILTRSIIAPLRTIKLENLSKIPYDELKPFVQKVKNEHRLVKNQLKILKQKQSQILLLAQNMSDGFLLLNKRGKVLLANKKAQAYLGGALQNIYESKDTFFLQKTLFLLSRFKTERSTPQTLEFAHKECELLFGPIYSKKKFKGMMVLVRDLSAKKRAQMLQRHFSANVTHELKTPLTSILAASEMMSNNLVAKEDFSEFVGKIEREAGRLLAMIDEVLKLSFLDEQRELTHTLPMQKLSLKAIIQSVLERLKLIAQKQHISIHTKLEDCAIMGNAELIENLVYNLCDNAIKYNKPKGSVHIALQKSDGKVVLEVRDSGVGIPKDAQERVFERFFCVDKGRSKQLGGTGLGLSIVESVAGYHNASVNLKSKLGEGSTFSVCFGQATTSPAH